MDKQLVLFENKNILDQEKFPSRKRRMIKVECNQECIYSLQSALVPIWGVFLKMYLQHTVCFSTNLGSILKNVFTVHSLL
jgi:hypothetical protein